MEAKFLRMHEAGRAECETPKGLMLLVLKKDMPTPKPNSTVKVRGCVIIEVLDPEQ